MKKLSAVLCVIILLTLTACMPENTEIKYRLVIEGIGVDYDKEKNVYEVTVQVLETENSEKSQSKTYTVKGETIAEAISSLTESTGKYPLYSQNRIIILGSSVMGDRMIKTLNFFVREYTSRPDVYIVAATGKASDVLGVSSAGESTAKLIETEIERSNATSVCIDTKLFNTVNLSLEENSTFVIPLAEVTDEYGGEKTVKVTGSSVFSKDGKGIFLSDTETFFTLLASDKAKKGTFTSRAEDIRAALEIMNTDTKIEISEKDGKPVFDIKIRMTVDITEYESSEFTDLNAEAVKKIEQQASEYIKSGVNAVTDRIIKKEKSDILRLGRRFFKKYPDEYEKIKDNWQELLPEIQINISADVKVGRIGQMTITR